VFCPEDGGPYRLKPRVFGSAEGWADDRPRDGVHLARAGGRDTVLGRFGGREYRLDAEAGRMRYAGDGFDLVFDAADPVATLAGDAAGEVDLTYFYIMDWLRKALLAPGAVNWVSAALEP